MSAPNRPPIRPCGSFRLGCIARIKSGIAAAKARGKRLGRQPAQRPSDRKAKKVLKLAEAGLSYRLIGRHVGLSKNTVGAILQRARAANQ
jgi:putative DNA-invertase from lambdoid prophage Rac